MKMELSLRGRGERDRRGVKIEFGRLSTPVDVDADIPLYGVANESEDGSMVLLTTAVPANRAVLINSSPIFKAKLDTQMEENMTSIIIIYNVSYKTLCSFVKYLHTAEVSLDEQMACDLLVLAEKYQVKHLKSLCEKFMISKVSNENDIAIYSFAHQHHAKQLMEAALSSILENILTLTEREEYKELLDKDPRLVVEIYEAYFTRQVNTAEK